MSTTGTNLINPGAVAIDADDVQKSEPTTFFGKLTEDWWAVIIGGIIIITILVAALSSPTLKFTTPVYQWQTTDELVTKVFAASNLLLLGVIGVIFAALASVAIALSGGSTRNFLKGFALIYILGITALVVAGNKTVAYYGIEYVVFGLITGLIISNVFKT